MNAFCRFLSLSILCCRSNFDKITNLKFENNFYAYICMGAEGSLQTVDVLFSIWMQYKRSTRFNILQFHLNPWFECSNVRCSSRICQILSIPNANAANLSIYLNLNVEFIFGTCRLFLRLIGTFTWHGWYQILKHIWSGQYLFEVHGRRYARYTVYWHFIVIIIQQMDAQTSGIRNFQSNFSISMVDSVRKICWQ